MKTAEKKRRLEDEPGMKLTKCESLQGKNLANMDQADFAKFHHALNSGLKRAQEDDPNNRRFGANFFHKDPVLNHGICKYTGMDFTLRVLFSSGERKLVLLSDPICKVVSQTTALRQLKAELNVDYDFNTPWQPSPDQKVRTKGMFQGVTVLTSNNNDSYVVLEVLFADDPQPEGSARPEPRTLSDTFRKRGEEITFLQHLSGRYLLSPTNKSVY